MWKGSVLNDRAADRIRHRVRRHRSPGRVVAAAQPQDVGVLVKLPEPVRWLERDYDLYKVEERSAALSHGIELMTTWCPGVDIDTGCYLVDRYEMGYGSSHKQPMFTLKRANMNWAYCYEWESSDFVPLSLASNDAPLEDEPYDD